MSLGTFNRRHEITVKVYQESEPTRTTGGNSESTVSESVDLKILFMHQFSRIKRRENGQRYTEEIFTFQVSSRELDSVGITMETGRTFIIYKSNTYRIRTVKDYTMYPLTRAMQCTAVRTIYNAN